MRKNRLFLVLAVLVLSLSTGVVVQALPGGVWQTGIKVQNLSSTDTATIIVALYELDGTLAYTLSQTAGGSPLQAGPGGSVELYMPNYTSVADGIYSAEVSSDQPLGVVATNTDYSYGLADSYNGSQGATEAFVPYVYHDHNYWTTEIFVQNTADSVANVFCTMTDGTKTDMSTVALAARGTTSFDTAQSAYDGLGWFIGSATITSTEDAMLAVVVNEARVVGSGDADGNLLVSYRGLTAADGGDHVVLPSLYKEFSGVNGTWRSGIKIQNTSSTSSTTVDVNFYTDPDSASGPWTGARTGLPIPAGESVELYLANPVLNGGGSLPDMFKGYAVIDSAGADVVATVIHTNYAAAGNKGVSVGYFGIASGSDLLSMPSLYRWPSGAGEWVSGIKIQNVGATTATVTVDFSTDPDSPNPTWTGTRSNVELEIGEAIEFYLANPILDGGASVAAPPWKGSASASCAEVDCEIAATVIHTNYGRHVANMYMAIPK